MAWPLINECYLSLRFEPVVCKTFEVEGFDLALHRLLPREQVVVLAMPVEIVFSRLGIFSDTLCIIEQVFGQIPSLSLETR